MGEGGWLVSIISPYLLVLCRKHHQSLSPSAVPLLGLPMLLRVLRVLPTMLITKMIK